MVKVNKSDCAQSKPQGKAASIRGLEVLRDGQKRSKDSAARQGGQTFGT